MAELFFLRIPFLFVPFSDAGLVVDLIRIRSAPGVSHLISHMWNRAGDPLYTLSW